MSSGFAKSTFKPATALARIGASTLGSPYTVGTALSRRANEAAMTGRTAAAAASAYRPTLAHRTGASVLGRPSVTAESVMATLAANERAPAARAAVARAAVARAMGDLPRKSALATKRANGAAKKTVSLGNFVTRHNILYTQRKNRPNRYNRTNTHHLGLPTKTMNGHTKPLARKLKNNLPPEFNYYWNRDKSNNSDMVRSNIDQIKRTFTREGDDIRDILIFLDENTEIRDKYRTIREALKNNMEKALTRKQSELLMMNKLPAKQVRNFYNKQIYMLSKESPENPRVGEQIRELQAEMDLQLKIVDRLTPEDIEAAEKAWREAETTIRQDYKDRIATLDRNFMREVDVAMNPESANES